MLLPRYFVDYWGNLEKDPLDKGVNSFGQMNGENGAWNFFERVKSKGYNAILYEGYDMQYRGSPSYPIK